MNKELQEKYIKKNLEFQKEGIPQELIVRRLEIWNRLLEGKYSIDDVKSYDELVKMTAKAQFEEMVKDSFVRTDNIAIKYDEFDKSKLKLILLNEPLPLTKLTIECSDGKLIVKDNDGTVLGKN